MDIDLNTVREMRAHAETLGRYYADTAKKRAQNDALIAAGLAPLHSESALKWDEESAAKHARFVETCDAILAHFGEPATAEAA
jgi:acetyl-CoA carboxylase carboxyltransferase component